MKSGLNKGMYHQGIQQPLSGLKAGIKGFDDIHIKKTKRQFKNTIVGLSGSQGMQLLFSGNADDNNYSVGDIGFDFPFYQSIYKNNIFVGSNSYITFGFGSSAYRNLSSSNPGKSMLIAADDCSIQQLFVNIDKQSQIFRIRFEGSNSTSGIIGSPTKLWEVSLFAEGVIQLVTGEEFSGGGTDMITDGTGSNFSNYFSSPSNSYVFLPSPENRYSVLNGSYN